MTRTPITADSETRFLLGVVAGAVTLAAGLVSLILAFSVTVSNPVTELSAAAHSVAFYGSLVVLGGAYLGREHSPRRAKLVAAVAAVAFVATGSTAFAPRSGSPRVSQVDRWLLGAVSLALLAAGQWLVRRAAQEVGW
ncbi:MAG: hypothetical protein ABEJ68_07230 [Halobacteriaceae archaeon]